MRRILVFIVAYCARERVLSVLERIPEEVHSNPNIDVLVLDDASYDATAEFAANWCGGKGDFLVLKNSENLGYGGNQKLGYQYAINQGYDLVILLHGDGQYSPELLNSFIQLYEKENADVILGSRMHSKESALGGGMPVYKYIGNRVLTMYQNWLTGMSLSEYHTGYRAYAVAFLKNIPFQYNTNDFHFDTEIILQSHAASAKIMELPIPTHYGDEKCHVNGLHYAMQVFRTTLQYKLHTIGMVCSLLYRWVERDRYIDKTALPYSSHSIALALVKELKPGTVLDIGCGSGYVSEQCRILGAEVCGVDMSSPLPGKVDQFIQADLNKGLAQQSIFDFDVVLLLDIIEHLLDPEKFLVDLRSVAPLMTERAEGIRETPPVVLISTPNIAFISIRLGLLFGRFNYAERGILDITHRRLFTKKSLLHMLKNCGYEVEKVIPVGVPAGAVITGRLGRWIEKFSSFCAKLLPTLFAFQYIVKCRPQVSVNQLLEKATVIHSSSGDQTLDNSR